VFKPLRKDIMNILDSLQLFPLVLLKLIIDYSVEVRWNNTPSQSWSIKKEVRGIKIYHRKMYVCDYTTNSLLVYDLTYDASINEMKREKQRSCSIENPTNMDIGENGSLYVIGRTHVYVLNPESEIVSSFKLPYFSGRGLRVDKTLIYLTIGEQHQIYIFDLNGTLIKTFGEVKSGNGEGQFATPEGVTTDKNCLYICDTDNHRVQILNKEDGLFKSEWGKEGTHFGFFTWPFSIFLGSGHGRGGTDMIYVGDQLSLQLFTREGKCEQRLGETVRGQKDTQFNHVFGFVIEDSYLYVCDFLNKRIQIFEQRFG